MEVSDVVYLRHFRESRDSFHRHWEVSSFHRDGREMEAKRNFHLDSIKNVPPLQVTFSLKNNPFWKETQAEALVASDEARVELWHVGWRKGVGRSSNNETCCFPSQFRSLATAMWWRAKSEQSECQSTLSLKGGEAAFWLHLFWMGKRLKWL